MKVLITGASGLVGAACVRKFLNEKNNVIGLYNSRSINIGNAGKWIKIDLSNQELITKLVLKEAPDLIINCAAVSNPPSVDLDPIAAAKVNIALPKLLAELSIKLNTRLIHISTDMVFNGKKGNYSVCDQVSPPNSYGNQKLEAEKVIQNSGLNNFVILRITIVMGNSPGGKRSIHEKIFEILSMGEKAKLFADEIRQPCHAENIADVIFELRENTEINGIFHWAGDDFNNRFQIGKLILQKFNLPLSLIEPLLIKNTSGFENRPTNLTLNIDSLKNLIKTKPETITEQINKLTVPTQFEKWYNNSVL